MKKEIKDLFHTGLDWCITATVDNFTSDFGIKIRKNGNFRSINLESLLISYPIMILILQDLIFLYRSRKQLCLKVLSLRQLLFSIRFKDLITVYQMIVGFLVMNRDLVKQNRLLILRLLRNFRKVMSIVLLSVVSMV